MLKQVKKTIAILLLVCFLASVTAAAATTASVNDYSKGYADGKAAAKESAKEYKSKSGHGSGEIELVPLVPPKGKSKDYLRGWYDGVRFILNLFFPGGIPRSFFVGTSSGTTLKPP